MSWQPTRTTNSASFDRLVTVVRSKVSGASEAVVSQEIANTFQALCRETFVWRELVTRNLIGGLANYEITPAYNAADVVFILSVEADGRGYRPMGHGAVPRVQTYGAYAVAGDYKTITLYPTPSADNAKALQVWVALAPRVSSLDFPCEIIDHYFEQIQDGVLERLYGHTNRPYTNPGKEELHRRKFHASVTRIRRDVRGGNAGASPPWRFHTQAPGRNLRGSKAYGW